MRRRDKEERTLSSMKRNAKRALVVLGIAVPLVVLWATREAASRRPVKVGYEPTGWNEVVYSTELRDDVFLQTPSDNPNPGMEARSYVLSAQLRGTAAIVFDGSAYIHVINHKTHQTIATFRDTTKIQNEENDFDASIVLDNSRLFLFGHLNAWVWDLKSKRLLHHWKLKRFDKDDVFLTSVSYLPHTGLIIQAMGPQIRMWNAQTGRLVGTSAHPLVNFNSEAEEGWAASHVSFSSNGKFCFYDTKQSSSSAGPSHIALCQSGKTLWKLDFHYKLGFGGDDKTVLAQWEPTPVVEVRDIQNGKLLHKLKIRPDCTFIGSSFDGNTLYTHNGKGEVFRQRIK